jgi:hypothetical protein
MSAPRCRAGTLASLVLLLGCGSNAPELPEELVGGETSCAATDYPEQGFGAEQGDTLKNVCFEGYRAPHRVPPAPEHVETVAFSDFYDPAGTKGVGLLLINTSAVWCGACISEHGTLPERVSELEARGLVVLSALFQDARREPATLGDLERWVDEFDTNFPMVIDPALELGIYASPDSAPLNMIVDPRSMRILRKYVGDQAAAIWPFIEAELELRSAAR